MFHSGLMQSDAIRASLTAIVLRVKRVYSERMVIWPNPSDRVSKPPTTMRVKKAITRTVTMTSR